MVLHRAHTMKPEWNHFIFRTYKKSGPEVCTGHYIREVILDQVVLEALRQATAITQEHTQKFAEYIGGRQSAEAQREIRKQEKELAAMWKGSTELDAIFKRLYEDSVLGRITTEQFQTLSGSYTKEQEQLRHAIPEREDAIRKLWEPVTSTEASSQRPSDTPTSRN